MPKKQPYFRIFLFTLIGLVFSAILTIIAFFLWWNQMTQPIDNGDTSKQQVDIPKGYGVSAIGDLLAKKGLIKNSLAFKLMVKKEGLGMQLQAGSYSISKSQSLLEIVQSLTKGVEDFWVTIPEGKRLEEIAKILNDEFSKQGLPFSIPEFMVATKELEGYLFPDTYLFPKTISTAEVVKKLRLTFDERISDEVKTRAGKFGLSFQQVLILASLVEREAKFQSDRSKIAGVLINRINKDMPLQIDATVQYAQASRDCGLKLGKECNWWPQITETSLKSDYNTYQNIGLPPLPICNPGKAVIEAVLDPDTHGFLYYLSEANGTTHYAKTLDEHEQNIHRYLE